MQSLANYGHFLAISYRPKVFSNGNIGFDDSKEFDELQVADGLKFISNESMDFNDPKEFDDPQVFNDPKGISIGSVGSDNPKFYCDIFIFDGLFICASIS